MQQQKVPLFTGGIPTAVGYFGQGAGKFGGVEVIKIQLAKYLGDEKAYEHKVGCTLVASAVAETLTDILWLCPFEAIRIKQVNDPGLGMAVSFKKIMVEEGLITGFYSGLVPLLCKQVPCKCDASTVYGDLEGLCNYLNNCLNNIAFVYLVMSVRYGHPFVAYILLLFTNLIIIDC